MNFSSAESESMIPCWGPGRVLCVEPVITSAPSRSGSWNLPPAMSPITCAASYQTWQPASWKASRSSVKGVGNRKTLCPKAATFGFTSVISFAVPSTSMFIRSTSNG